VKLQQPSPLDPPMDSVASNSDNGKNGKIHGNYFPLKKVHIYNDDLKKNCAPSSVNLGYDYFLHAI
jgi:hypothetical protein